MNDIKYRISDINMAVKKVDAEFNVTAAVYKKEREMLRKFEDDLERIKEDWNNELEAHQHLVDKIDELANFILENIGGEPSKNEGAIDTAIRLLKAKKEVKELGESIWAKENTTTDKHLK